MTRPGSSPDTSAVRETYMRDMRRKRLYGGLLLALFVLLMVSGFVTVDARSAGSFRAGLPKLFDFPSEVLSEAATRFAELPALLIHYLPSLIETLNIAAAATLFGTIVAIFLSLLATRGLAPRPGLIPFVRRLMDILRAVPEIVTALVLIFILGGGPVPAMIAIMLHTFGALGKLFSEVNENAAAGPIDGLRSTGARWGQQMWLGVVPQVAPNYLSYTLLRFEINIRASAILGFVGAGGIGYDLRNAISWGQGKYADASAIFILLFATIVLFDQISSAWRNRLTHGTTQ